MTEPNEDVVIEVLGDREGDKAGSWGALSIVSSLGTCDRFELINSWIGWYQVEFETNSC